MMTAPRSILVLRLLLLLPPLFAAAGCVRRGGRPVDVLKAPVMRRAIQAERDDDVDKAVSLYREAANAYPYEPLPNLQLANLLFEQKEDYLGAIFHYKRFLELVGEDNQRFAAVNDRIRVAGQKLAYRYAGTIAEGSANENVRLVQDITQQNRKIARLEEEKAGLVKSNEVLMAELRLSKARNVRLALLVQKMRPGGPDEDGGAVASAPGTLSPHVIANEDGTRNVIQTYEVRRGDNLSRIANECYGDAALWKRIKEANPDKIEKGDRVRPGDVLIIPAL